MSWATNQEFKASEGHSAGRAGTWRRAAGMLAASVGLAIGITFATAGGAAAACPPGTSLFRNLCIVIGLPPLTPTTTPVTTPPTTAPPIVSLPPVTLPPVVTPPTTPQLAPSAAQRLLDLANAERGKAGLGPLTSRNDIVDIAVAHSREMAQKGTLYHSTSFFGATIRNLLNAAVRGENVAYNGDVENTHARLMASAGHRANILNPVFSAVGIGVVQAADGRYFVTQDFIQPAGAPPVARAAAPRVAAPAAARKAPVPTTAAPAPPTTVPAPTTTVAPPPPAPAPVEAAPPVVAIDDVSSAVSTTSPAQGHQVTPPLAAAAVLLLGAMVACCMVIPRNRWA